jgi:hypothetical protein
MTTTSTTPSVTTPVKVPLRERFNFRILAFAAIVLALIGFPMYIYLDSALSGGIHDRGDYLECDLKAMSTFPFDQNNGTRTDVPKQWRDLDGKRVQVVGEIYAPDSASPQLEHFQLVYSIAKCCFNGPPQIQHFVQAKAASADKPVPYYQGLVKVTGTLHVDVKRDAGKVTQVYAMDVERAEPI